MNATVTGSGYGGSPSGTVEFLDGGTELGTASLSWNGQATLYTSVLGAGLQNITAVYDGGFNFLGSTSSVLTQTVDPTITNPGRNRTPKAVRFRCKSNRRAVGFSSSAPGAALRPRFRLRLRPDLRHARLHRRRNPERRVQRHGHRLRFQRRLRQPDIRAWDVSHTETTPVLDRPR